LKQEISEWVSVDIMIADKYKEIAMDFAMANGGLAIVENDDHFQVSYPFDDEIQTSLKELKTFLMDLDPSVSVKEKSVFRENWNKEWQNYFKPTEISPDLVVLPEWENPNDFSHKIKTRIKPAMAFGTGTHETTQLCLQILEEYIQGNEKVLDVGTGSGILGITALHLGASQVDAIENDSLTEENISDNLLLNEISNGFDLQITESPILNNPYDLMVINIIRARLFPILPNYFDSVISGGKAIVSGLLVEEDSDTRALLANSPWTIKKTFTKNEWIAYLCEVK